MYYIKRYYDIHNVTPLILLSLDLGAFSEHLMLRCSDCMLKALGQRETGRAYIYRQLGSCDVVVLLITVYDTYGLQTNRAGLKHIKVNNKMVK